MTSVFTLKKQNFRDFLEACQNHVFLEISEYEREDIVATIQQYNEKPIVPNTSIELDDENDRLRAKSSSEWVDLTPEQLRDLLKFFSGLGTYADYWCDVFADEELLTTNQITEIFSVIEETFE